MKNLILAAALAGVAAMPALAQTAQTPAAGAAPAAAPAGAGAAQTFEAPIVGAKGDKIGTVSLRGDENSLVARIEIQAGGLQPGWHGAHFHAVGDCSDVGQFQKSGGHVGKSDQNQHGHLNPRGPEPGDLPNIYAGSDGGARAEMATSLVGLSGANGLMDQDGSALVIHANPDDHTTQPIGGAGDRVACAEVKRR